MNTIPLTFNEHQINRTIFGGKQNNDKNALNISVILLNSSSGIFKNCLFENLLQCNFCSIICVEQKFSNSTSIDNLSKKFPTVKFILLLEDSTEGEMINIAMGEVESDFVLVIKDSLYIPNNVITPHLAERLLKYDAFCLVPRLLDSEKNGVSCAYKPSIDGKKFVIEEFSIIRDGIKTIYAFDNIGLYNRKKFIQLGGFDWTIKNSYWQNLDFFMRSWLWGEQTILTTLIQFSYINDVPVEDRTINIDYLRYYLKNELPHLKLGEGIIKSSDFFMFLNRSSCGILEARRQFLEVKKWVSKNKFMFKKDLQKIIESWN